MATYLNYDCIGSLSSETFQKQHPYPWVNIEDTLTPQAFEELRGSLPEVDEFRRMVGVKRGHGQAPHDRFLLHYMPALKLAEPWKNFVSELQAPAYNDFLHRMLGLPSGKQLTLTFEWYYAWRGCAVSPHCDARRKIATHIFYFNTNEDWEDSWGGQILMLDDEGRFKSHSAPEFDDFRSAASVDPRGNGSLLFQRTDHSWHGVRPLQPPPDHLRKLFLVTVNIPTFQVWWRGVRGKDPDGFRIRAA